VVKAALGVEPILYTSARVWRDDLGNSASTDLVDCPLWLARYRFRAGLPVRSGAAFTAMAAPPVPPPWGDEDSWWIHQYQGDATGFPGFSGKVDLNRFNPYYTGNGARARWVQRRLGVDVDGRFGDASKAALAAFQEERGLIADRLVGPRTFAYLGWQVV
jgi:peptidoglycan hydrolase-like protein with peptidoglycan-binding domain